MFDTTKEIIDAIETLQGKKDISLDYETEIKRLDELVLKSLNSSSFATSLTPASQDVSYTTQYTDKYKLGSLFLNCGLIESLKYLVEQDIIRPHKLIVDSVHAGIHNPHHLNYLFDHAPEVTISNYFEKNIIFFNPKNEINILYLVQNHKDKINVNFTKKITEQKIGSFFNEFYYFLNSRESNLSEKELCTIVDCFIEQLLPLKELLFKHINEEKSFFSTHYLGFMEACLFFTDKKIKPHINYFFEQLFDKGFLYNANMEEIFKNRKPFLHDCCEKGLISLIQKILDKNPKYIHLKDKKNKEPIFYVRDSKTFECLIKNGAKWNISANNNYLITELYAMSAITKNADFKKYLEDFIQKNNISYKKTFANRSLISWMLNTKTDSKRNLKKIKEFTQKEILKIACETGNLTVLNKLDDKTLKKLIKEPINGMNVGMLLFYRNNNKKKFYDKLLMLEKFMDLGLDTLAQNEVILKNQKKPQLHNILTLFFATQKMYTVEEKFKRTDPESLLLQGRILEKLLRLYDWNNMPNWTSKNHQNFIIKGLHKNAYLFYPFDLMSNEFKKHLFFEAVDLVSKTKNGINTRHIKNLIEEMDIEKLVFTSEELEQYKTKINTDFSNFLGEKTYFNTIYEFLVMHHEKQKTAHKHHNKAIL